MISQQEKIQEQLGVARKDLETWGAALTKKGVEEKAHSRDPKWRRLNAQCRALTRRLKAVKSVIKRDEECIQRAADKVEAAKAEKAPKKEKEKGKAKGEKGDGDKAKKAKPKKKEAAEK